MLKASKKEKQISYKVTVDIQLLKIKKKWMLEENEIT